MNAKVKMGGVITLPNAVVEALGLEDGSEVSFSRSTEGGFVLTKIPEGAQPTREQIRERLRLAAIAARNGIDSEMADMTTDELMEFLRGD